MIDDLPAMLRAFCRKNRFGVRSARLWLQAYNMAAIDAISDGDMEAAGHFLHCGLLVGDCVPWD